METTRPSYLESRNPPPPAFHHQHRMDAGPIANMTKFSSISSLMHDIDTTQGDVLYYEGTCIIRPVLNMRQLDERANPPQVFRRRTSPRYKRQDGMQGGASGSGYICPEIVL